MFEKFSTQKKVLFITVGLFIVSLAVFTFFDLEIALGIYTPDSFFGKFFEIVGTSPSLIIGIFSCVAMILTERATGKKGILKKIGWCTILVLFAIICITSFHNAITEGIIWVYIGSVIWFILSIFLCKKVIKNGKEQSLRVIAKIGIICTAVAVFALLFAKMILSRPRFYLLEDPKNEFTYWFVPHEFNKLSINSSFPSGHAAQAALSFWFLLLPSVMKADGKKFTIIAFVMASLFTVCVALSRMVLGMHYATDVIAGAFFIIITLQVCCLFYHKELHLELNNKSIEEKFCKNSDKTLANSL